LTYELACTPCIRGFHDECSKGFSGELEDGEVCCCGGDLDMGLAYVQMVAEEGMQQLAAVRGGGKDALFGGDYTVEKLPPRRGDSGYIHPDAWVSHADIGSLANPKDSGYKRMKRMYPISPGQVCEWARMANAGPGPVHIIGCMGNPATDLHHGPDKNTLNNEKVTRGIGDRENVHAICSPCHVRWHAANDDLYPAYDRVAQQTEAWLPAGCDHQVGPLQMIEADFDQLVDEERKRAEQDRQRGRDHRGRNSGPRGVGDFDIDEDGE